MALLDVKNLCVDFHTDQGTVHAVRDISFSVGESEAVGIVGESGSGKSVTMYSVMGLLAGNGSITGGSVSLNGQEITESAFPDHKAYEAAMEQDPRQSDGHDLPGSHDLFKSCGEDRKTDHGGH